MATSSFRPASTGSRLFGKRTALGFALVVVAMIVGLALLGFTIHRSIERELRSQLSNQMETVLDAEIGALRTWLETQRGIVSAIGESGAIRQLMEQQDASMLRGLLAPSKSIFEFDRIAVVDGSGVIHWQNAEGTVDHLLGPAATPWLQQAIGGEAGVSQPLPSGTWGSLPVLLATAPIAGHDNRALVVSFDPHDRFSGILELARAGRSGETYAFDRDGWMVSQSRFLQDIKDQQLIDPLASSSIHQFQLRSPRPGKTPTRADPFTEAVASALAGEDGINLDGYLDYRGVYVIGAWAWLPDYDLGIVTELDLSEAQKPLWALRQTFAGLFILLVLAAAGVAIYHRVQTVTARRAARAERKAEELGQYLIEGKIGEGGMGVVYRARHRLLRRPTAIKMLRDSERDSEARERFEREVRTTCNLTHPNTIAVYDYGQTDDNSFYYAMEFLIGEDLENLVIKHGPMQSGRVIHILRQACGSLAEAHDLGLIHRDIKPANIYVCERGGLTDFVKVLDFGLVKSIKSEAVNLTAAEMICGTPQYMAPEIISQDEDETDGRVDIYSLACVGYFLLTGRPVFERRAVMDTLLAHINEEPPPPGQFRSSDLPDDLVELIMAALSKDPNVRPQSARAFEQALAKLADANSWDQQRACDWWRVNEPAIAKRQSTRVSDRVVGISLSRR